jgi:hypothetical protein
MSATQAEPFQPLMSEGGRPPPTNGHAPSNRVEVKVDEECQCVAMRCPESGDEVWKSLS